MTREDKSRPFGPLVEFLLMKTKTLRSWLLTGAAPQLRRAAECPAGSCRRIVVIARAVAQASEKKAS